MNEYIKRDLYRYGGSTARQAYNPMIRSAMNTAAQAQAATTGRLFFLQPNITATVRPQAAEIRDWVA